MGSFSVDYISYGEVSGRPFSPTGSQDGKLNIILTGHNSFRQNPNYHLPPSLAPTRIQRTIAHEHLIDGVVQPSLRDQMILMRGKYNILKVFRDLSTQYEIPGGEYEIETLSLPDSVADSMHPLTSHSQMTHSIIATGRSLKNGWSSTSSSSIESSSPLVTDGELSAATGYWITKS